MEKREIKYIADNNGAGNFDDADFALGANEWVNMENMRTGSTDKGVTAVGESIGGTLLISAQQPSVTFLEIGSAIDNENSRMCYLKYNTTGNNHKIVCYDEIANAEYDVLLSSQVTGGLGFNKNYIIHSAFIVNGLLYWTDNLNQLRRVNIDAGIKLNHPTYSTTQAAYTSPLEQWVISTIRRPAGLAPTVTKVDNLGATNFIKYVAARFAYRYSYRDNETSVIGDYSLLVNRNLDTETYNQITVKMLFDEVIEQDVQIVELVMQFADDDKCFVIKTWDKNIASELAEIQQHNAGGTQLTYNFLNDITGIAIAPSTAIKQYEDVPIKAKTIELADNRQFIGNGVLGYNSPTTTSLAVSSVTSSGSTTGLYEIKTITVAIYGTSGGGIYNSYTSSPTKFIFMNNITVMGYYTAGFISVGATIAFAATTFYADSFANAAQALAQALATANGLTSWTTTGTTETSPGTITVTGVTTTTGTGSLVYKSDSPYQVGVVFKDFAGRRCGVVTKPTNKLTTPERAYADGTQTTGISWSLDNTSALTEIPDWAYYYQIVRTKSLRTRFFLQGRCPLLQYVLKSTAGVYTYQSTYSASAYGIAIEATLLEGYNVGYVYNEGDVLKLYLNTTGTVYTLPIIGQNGAYIYVQLKDIGTFTGVNNPKSIFEIYTPYQQSVNEPYYEVSQVYKINSPTTSSRSYSSISGSIVGDVSLINRTYNSEVNKLEAMSPNDKFWTQWLTVANKGNFIDKIGQKLLETTFQFSNTFIQGAKQNGLSTFDALDRKTLDANVGQIQRLINTSKVQNQQGGIMLAVCELETASIYIGEVQLYGSNAPSSLAQAPSVIGTVNILKGNYGTVNPESVVEYRGAVFFADAINKCWVQYASNGLFPISDYKAVRLWNLFFTQYLSMTATQIEALGGRPFIFATVDPYHKELLISVPKLLSVPPKGYLPDYPSTIYPFDTWDGQGKTYVYKLGVENNKPRWQGAYSFNPEGFAILLNKLYSFRQGHLYLHNQTANQCEFYGVQYKSKVMLVSNQDPTIPKIYNNISIQSNIVPNFVYFYNDYPYQQSSDLVDYDFNQLEGVWWATLYRNKLVPNASGFSTDGLLTGEKMRNVAMKILIEFSPTTTILDFKFVTLGYILSKGNK